MKSSSLEIWEAMARNPTENFEKAFTIEKELLLRNISKDSVVLDIGCGFGRVVKSLAPHVKKIIGIDNDKEAIEKTKESVKDVNNVEIILEDAEELSFGDETFDVVDCMGGTISNLGDTKKKIFSEVKRVLKDGGLFFCSSWNDDALEERLKFYEKYYPGEYTVNKETGYVEVLGKFVSEQFSKEQIKNMLEENGFEVLETIKEGVLTIAKAKKIK